MQKSFEEALEELIDEYAGNPGWRAEIVAALRLKAEALDEEGDDET